MRKPKVENKYNLTMKKINKLSVVMNQRLRNLYFGEIMLSMHGVLVERLGLIKIYSTALITSFG